MVSKIKAASMVAGAIFVGLAFNHIAIAVTGEKATVPAEICVDNRANIKQGTNIHSRCPKREVQTNTMSVQTAIFRADYDANEPDGPGIYNSQRSRGVQSVVRVMPDGYPSGYCIKLSFDARYISLGSVYSALSSNTDEAQITRDACGSGYNYFAWGTAATTIFFTE